MNLKESSYNFFFPFDAGHFIAFNALTCALALLENEQYHQYQQFVDQKGELSEAFRDQLLFAGFLVPSATDELQWIRERMFASRYCSNILGLTIAPTLACNFHCAYCYEKGVEQAPKKMSLETQEELIRFIEGYCPTIRSLDVAWYGGEPLLAEDVIVNLTDQILRLVEDHGLRYGASMITNGYLLTPDTLQRLKKVKLKWVQITLDGPAHIHDRRRYLYDGSPTFQTIIDNIKAVCDDIKVILRVNTDMENLGDCEELLSVLRSEGILHKVSPYFAPVVNRGANSCSDKCFSLKQFSAHNFTLWKKLREWGIRCENLYPQVQFNLCGADQVNSFVVDPTGHLYKCWAEIGQPDFAVGRLDQQLSAYQKVAYRNQEAKYLLLDATEKGACRQCGYLPLCLGGCPFDQLNQVESCCFFKDNLEPILRDMILDRLSAQNHF